MALPLPLVTMQLENTIVGGVRLEAGKLVVDNGDPGDCASSDLVHPEF